MVKLGLLDYALIDENSDAIQAFHQTIELAQFAESLGYHRFWIAEHHNVPAFASSAPELMMMRVLDATKRIRLGSGGVMLPHYSPYKVAENFRILEAFHPGRVDLGIGNTIGTKVVNAALNEHKERKLNYEASIVDLTTYFQDQAGDTHRFPNIVANPVIPTVPEMWTLSTSAPRAKMAAQLGIGFTYGHFLVGDNRIEQAIEAVETYRQHFKPSRFMKEPTVSLAIIVVVTETEEQTEDFQTVLDAWLLGKENFSYYTQFPSVETASRYVYSEQEKKIVEANRQRVIIGNADDVKARVDALVGKLTADELLFVPLIPSFEQRKKTIALLANLFLT